MDVRFLRRRDAKRPFLVSDFGHSTQEQQAFHVVDEIGHADLGLCPSDPDGADKESHPFLLRSEHVLDA